MFKNTVYHNSFLISITEKEGFQAGGGFSKAQKKKKNNIKFSFFYAMLNCHCHWQRWFEALASKSTDMGRGIGVV